MKEHPERDSGPIVLRTREHSELCRTSLEFVGNEDHVSLFDEAYANWARDALGEITSNLQMDYSLIGGLPFRERAYRFRLFFDPNQRRELDHGKNVPEWSDISVRDGAIVTDYGYLAKAYAECKQQTQPRERLEKYLDIETLRALLHEIFHLTHIQELGPHNAKVPSWLKEGMAERIARNHIGAERFRTPLLLDVLSKRDVLRPWPTLGEIGKAGHFGINTAELSENPAYLSSMMATISIFDDLRKKGYEPLPFIFELAKRSDSMELFEALLFKTIEIDITSAKGTMELQEKGRRSYERGVTQRHGGLKRKELWDAALYDPSAFF